MLCIITFKWTQRRLNQSYFLILWTSLLDKHFVMFFPELTESSGKGEGNSGETVGTGLRYDVHPGLLSHFLSLNLLWSTSCRRALRVRGNLWEILAGNYAAHCHSENTATVCYPKFYFSQFLPVLNKNQAVGQSTVRPFQVLGDCSITWLILFTV